MFPKLLSPVSKGTWYSMWFYRRTSLDPDHSVETTLVKLILHATLIDAYSCDCPDLKGDVQGLALWFAG